MKIFGYKFKDRGGWIVPAVLGASALISGFSKKPKAPKYVAPDLTGTLAAIDAYYKQAGAQTEATMGRQLQGQQKMTGENLAGRGIYSSPVSEYAFQQNRQQNQMSLADALASLGGQQLQAKANITGQAAMQGAQGKYQAELQKYQDKLQSSNMLTGLLSSGALASLQGLGGGAKPQGMNPSQPTYMYPNQQQPNYLSLLPSFQSPVDDEIDPWSGLPKYASR